MNERIQVLAEQANKYSLSNVNQDSEFFHTIAMAKFAELIVRECADFVSNDRQNDEYGIFVANRIKEHFGVKESLPRLKTMLAINLPTRTPSVLTNTSEGIETSRNSLRTGKELK